MHMFKKNWQFALPILIPLAYFVLVTIMMPRPYYIQPADLEQDYYYGAKLVYDGYPPYGIHHPGTPIYELGALIMHFSGDQLENAQTFFNLGYLAIALANIIGLLIFSRIPSLKKNWGYSALTMLSLVALPGWMSYSHTFGGDSFLTPTVLIMLACFWISLDLSIKQRTLMWVVVGFLAGLGMAIKLSVLPVWIAVILCSIVFNILVNKTDKSEIRAVRLQYFIIPVISVVSFILFILPTFARLPQIFTSFILRDDIQTVKTLFEIKRILQLLASTGYLIPVYVMVVASGLILIYLTGKAILSRIKVRMPIDPKILTKGLLLFLMLVSLTYSVLCISITANDYEQALFDPGVTLRNCIPTGLFLPFAILFILEIFSGKLPGFVEKQWISTVLGSALLCSSWIGYLNHRAQFIAYEEQLVQSNTTMIQSYSSTNSRVAVWDGSPGNLYGEAGFHFWGNFTYAREFYDTELLSYFPNLTFLKLRDVHDLLSYSSETASASGWLTLWKRIFPSPYYMSPNSEMIMGHNREEPISTIAVPEDEIYEEGTTLDELSQLVSERLGVYQVVERNIDNVNWIIFELSVDE